MRREQVVIVRQGLRYRLGRTEAYGGIWRKRPWGWRLVARYPLNDEGWRIAEGQFAMWEPEAGFGAEGGSVPTTSGPSGTTPPVGTVLGSSRRRLGVLGWVVVALAVVVLAGAGVLTDRLVAAKSATAASRTPGTKASGSKAGRKASGTKALAPRRTTTTTTYTRPPVGGGWLAAGNSWVVFIQWSSTRGAFSGTAQYVTLSGSPPTLKLTTTSVPVTGTLQGNRITLAFQGRPEQFGTIATGRFTINFPQSNGSLAPITFVAASSTRYNQALGALRARVTGTNTAAAQAAAKAKAETAIDQAATAVQSEIKGLSTQATALSRAVTGVKGALASETEALSTTKSAAASVNACYDANNVGYDANNVGYDATNVGYTVATVKREISSIKAGIASLTTAMATLQAKEQGLAGYIPPDQPTPTGIQQAAASAQAAIAQAVSATNGYITQANADVKAADTVATQAERAASCTTTTLTPFTPVPAITG